MWHAIHQNIATGIFWCDCDGFKSHNEQDAKYHMMQNSPKQAKKPYIRKEHLTDRPFADNEALKALRDSLPEAEKFNPGKKPRTDSMDAKYLAHSERSRALKNLTKENN